MTPSPESTLFLVRNIGSKFAIERILLDSAEYFEPVTNIPGNRPRGAAKAALVPKRDIGGWITKTVSSIESQFITVSAALPEIAEYRLHQLLPYLARYDAVFAKRQRTPWGRQVQRLSRLPAWFMGTLHVRDPDLLCWAARSDALRDLDLSGRRFQRLPRLVSERGYRVGEVNLPRPIGEGRQTFRGQTWYMSSVPSSTVGNTPRDSSQPTEVIAKEHRRRAA